MHTNRHFFLNHIAQTSNEPLLLEITHAKGCEMFDGNGRSWLDLISGISVSSVGHSHPEIIKAVNGQVEKHMHLMVYGELVQSPQVLLAKELTALLPYPLTSCYFTNSGTEAIEGAMKLAKRHTGRHNIIAFNNAYHGSTQGALSLIGSEYWRNSYRPLLPCIYHHDFNDNSVLHEINDDTACVVVEVIQGEAGAVLPLPGYLKKLKDKCVEAGALLIVDEIQTGFRRTGPLMAFMKEDFVPDILVLAKAIGGGMPIGAFISSTEIMNTLKENPVLGHITTFGGHPVSCAAALASLRIVNDITEESILKKEELFRQKLVHPKIVSVTGKGLLLGVELESEEICKKLITSCLEKGVFTDWFLFAPHKLRIAPPLIIEDHQIFMACEVILKALEEK